MMSLGDDARDAYVLRLAANADEPPELLALSAGDPAAENGWRSAHFLVRAELCAFSSDGRFGWRRRWRAKTATKADATEPVSDTA
jgi:hypothetical protein